MQGQFMNIHEQVLGWPDAERRLRWVCIHEAGHAVVAAALGLECKEVWVIEKIADGGYVSPTVLDWRWATVAVAGYLANQLDTTELDPQPWEYNEWSVTGDPCQFNLGVTDAAMKLSPGPDKEVYESAKRQIENDVFVIALGILRTNWYVAASLAVGLANEAPDLDGRRRLTGDVLASLLKPVKPKNIKREG